MTAFVTALEWAGWSARRDAPRTAAEAHDLATSALEELVRGQLLRSDQELWLHEAADTATAGALAHVRAGDPQAAVVALERRRAVLFTEALRLGPATADRLRDQGQPELAARYRRAAGRLSTLRGTTYAARSAPGTAVREVTGQTPASS